MDDETALALIRRVHQWSPFPTEPASSQESQPSFRLMDLPAEIRNMIYTLLVTGKDPIRLAYTKPPAITRASRQIRAEALPVFFDVNTFAAEVRMNYFYHSDFFGAEYPVYKRTGTLGLKKQVLKLFQISGSKDARIKNLLILPMYQFRTNMGSPNHFKALLSMTHHTSANLPLIKINMMEDGGAGQRARDIERALLPAKAMLEGMVAEPGYKGLTLPQLKKVANFFGVQPARNHG